MQMFQHLFHQYFRIRARTEHILIDLESQSHKFRFSKDMLERNPLRPVSDLFQIPLLLPTGQLLFAMCIQRRPIRTADILQKQSGIQRRLLYPCPL